VLALVVLVVGVPYVYIHFIEGSAPARFHLPAASATTRPTGGGTASGSVPINGLWRVGAGSQAGYRVDEVLFGQSNTAVGRTTAVTGQLVITPSGVSNATVVVDLTKVSSDRSQRDNQFHGRIMDTASFPTATFTLTNPITLGSIPADGTTLTVKAKGNLTLRGTTRPAEVSLQARRSPNTIEVSGSIPITFATWNIPSPSFGPVTTQDHGLIEFLLSYAHA
jgi:polyisoprenoid-binding protein YceI